MLSFTKPTLGVRSSQARVVSQGSALVQVWQAGSYVGPRRCSRLSFLTALRRLPCNVLREPRRSFGILGHACIDRHLRPPDGVIPCLTIWSVQESGIGDIYQLGSTQDLGRPSHNAPFDTTQHRSPRPDCHPDGSPTSTPSLFTDAALTLLRKPGRGISLQCSRLSLVGAARLVATPPSHEPAPPRLHPAVPEDLRGGSSSRTTIPRYRLWWRDICGICGALTVDKVGDCD